MSGGLLKALRSDSYVELSEYRDQHFRVRRAGPREWQPLGSNAEKRFTLVFHPDLLGPKMRMALRCLDITEATLSPRESETYFHSFLLPLRVPAPREVWRRPLFDELGLLGKGNVMRRYPCGS